MAPPTGVRLSAALVAALLLMAAVTLAVALQAGGGQAGGWPAVGDGEGSLGEAGWFGLVLPGAGGGGPGIATEAVDQLTPLPPDAGKPPAGCVWSGHTPVFRGRRGPRMIALTFDDGPWPDTPRFVAVLERERVHATFFLIGRQIAGRAWLLRRELQDGDALGDHSWTHADLVRRGVNVGHEVRWARAEIAHQTGYEPCVFRPPYGAFNRGVVRDATADGMATILWDVDPTDWARPGSGAIERRILAQTRTGSIVLMHDGGGDRSETLAALPRVIRGLRRRGMRFVTVPELLGYRTFRKPAGR